MMKSNVINYCFHCGSDYIKIDIPDHGYYAKWECYKCSAKIEYGYTYHRGGRYSIRTEERETP
jgi:hypothetical protein